MSMKAMIVRIKGNSLDDGPGIRSVVFFKGCPLSCIWCHNPECISTKQELHYDPEKCIGCDSCIELCPEKAISITNPFFVDRIRCSVCMKCTSVCPAAALSPLGTWLEPRAIVDDVLRDKPFFDNSGGGVTLSGGEPALHLDYSGRLLSILKENNIHTLVETCGYFDLTLFREHLLPFIDTIYIDLKLIDPEEHRRYCGLTNELILENIVKLHELSRKEKFEILPRVPLVPGITATINNLTSIACFLQKFGIKKIELLPYNPLWGEKLYCTGRPDPHSSKHPLRQWMPREDLIKYRQLFADYGFNQC